MRKHLIRAIREIRGQTSEVAAKSLY